MASLNKKVLFSLFLIYTINCFAGFSDGKYAGEFINYSVDARAMSVGNMLITSPYKAGAVYYNPALISSITDNKSVLFSHSKRFSGLVNQEFLSGSFLIQKHKVGIAIIRIGVDDISLYKEKLNEDNRPEKYGEVNDNEVAVYIGTGFNTNITGFSYGVATKFLYKSFEEESATGIGFDLSCHYKFKENLIFAAKLADATTTILSWSTGLYEYIKPSLSLQSEYSVTSDYLLTDFTFFLGSKIGTEGYHDEAFASINIFDIELNCGAELYINKLFRFRLGTQNMDRYFGGAGISLDNLGMKIDYAFEPDYEDLGETHKISLGYNW